MFFLFCCCAVNLSTETTNKLRIYQEHFEKKYIECAVEFYTVHGLAYLSENGVQNYMKYVRVLTLASLSYPLLTAGEEEDGGGR